MKNNQKSNSKRKDSYEYVECKSDIPQGSQIDNDFVNEMDLDERKTKSDNHEIGFINELFEDDLKFEGLIAKL